MNTLFYDTKLTADQLMYSYSLKTSQEFINCADNQLTEIFIRETGLKPSKNVNLALTQHYLGAPIYSDYMKEDRRSLGRKLMICLYVNHNWNPITIFWKSKSGTRDYKLHDTDIDTNDIEFSFEKLDKNLYINQLYPNQKLPFKTSHLSFDLEIIRINIDCAISIVIKDSEVYNIEKIKNEVVSFINNYNINSEKKDRKFGVIHNCKTFISRENTIVNELDLGSTGIHFFKQFLAFLSKSNRFLKIIIE